MVRPPGGVVMCLAHVGLSSGSRSSFEIILSVSWGYPLLMCAALQGRPFLGIGLRNRPSAVCAASSSGSSGIFPSKLQAIAPAFAFLNRQCCFVPLTKSMEKAPGRVCSARKPPPSWSGSRLARFCYIQPKSAWAIVLQIGHSQGCQQYQQQMYRQLTHLPFLSQWHFNCRLKFMQNEEWNGIDDVTKSPCKETAGTAASRRSS